MGTKDNAKKQESEQTSPAVKMLRIENPQKYNIAEIQKDFKRFVLDEKNITVRGRIKDIRDMGKVTFATIEDTTGTVQLILEEIDHAILHKFKREVGKGDILEIYGLPTLSKNKTNSIKVGNLEVLTKAVKIAPRTLIDPEIRIRQRYLDLLVNSKTKETFLRIAKTLRNMRFYLYEEGFMEYETSILKPNYDGGTSKPFITTHNAIGNNFYLRVTSEIQLKELLVGGYEKVFEIGKSFRNEGIGKLYHPEFTLLEAYSINTDYNYAMELTERMVRRNVTDIFKATEFEYNGYKINVSRPWKRVSVKDAVKAHVGLDVQQLSSESEQNIKQISTELGLLGTTNYETLLRKIIEHKIRPSFIEPTFLIDLPSSLSPFAKEIKGNPFYSQRAWGYIGGQDMCDIFTDQNDPKIVKQKFEEEDEKLKDVIKHRHIHTDYIDALEYGLAPSSGIGFSMTRFYMIMTNKTNIRDVILFPHF